MKKKKDTLTRIMIIAGAIFLLIFTISSLSLFLFHNKSRQERRMGITPRLRTALVVGDTKTLNITNEDVFAPNPECPADREKYNLPDYGHHWCRRVTPTKKINLTNGNYRITLNLGSLNKTQKYEVLDFYLNNQKFVIPDPGANAGRTASYRLENTVHLNGEVSVRARHHYADEYTGSRYGSRNEGLQNSPESIILKSVVFEKMVQEPTCGDGNKDSGEECDSGSNNGQTCTAEYGGSCNYCDNDCKKITVTGPHCGDNHKDNEEECDDGDIINGDRCSDTCMIEEVCSYGS